MDLDLGDQDLQAEDNIELELSEQMECLAGQIHLHDPESDVQGVL